MLVWVYIDNAIIVNVTGLRHVGFVLSCWASKYCLHHLTDDILFTHAQQLGGGCKLALCMIDD